MALPDPSFWLGKRVVLTGHTGFKGSWLALWLQRLGAHVIGVALSPVTDPSLFSLAGVVEGMESHVCDVRDGCKTAALIRAARPDVVLHLAAQALVRPSYAAPLDTYATNVMGTAHVLDALRDLSGVRVAVVVTTDKVYRNREWVYPYREDDALGGHDPYSASKAAAEIVTGSYRDAFLSAQGVAVATARAGNVIGGGDWAPERLLPDAAAAWSAGQTLVLRNPHATRPWQHVLEPLAGYLRLAQVLWERPASAGAYNFGPAPQEAATVGQVIEMAGAAYPSAPVHYQSDAKNPHEAGLLALDTARAHSHLGITPCWALPDAVARTMAWYRGYYAGGDVRALCLSDLQAYEAACQGGAKGTVA